MHRAIYTNQYRVMYIQEEGSEACYADGLTEEKAYEAANELRESYPEARSIFIERQRDYNAEYLALQDDGYGDMY